MRRKFAEQMDNGAEAHTSRMRRLAEAAPKRATQFRQAENLIRFRRAIDGDGPMKVGQQLRLWGFARAIADDPDGVRHMNRDMVLEMLAAIRGDGALGEMQNVRLNRGLAPGAPGRPFRVLMNGILAGARYAAEMDPAQIDQAQADILRIDPDRAETWHAIFDLMDRLRMDDNTRNTPQLKEVAEAVAHLAIGARAAEEKAKPKPKPEPDDNTDNGDGDDGRKENEGDDLPDNNPDRKTKIKRRFERLIGSAIEKTYKSFEPWDNFLDRPWGKYIKETLDGVNPHYKKGGPNNNCVSCALAATRRLTGKDPDAISEPSSGAVWPNNLLPEYPWGAVFDTNLSEVEAELIKQGDGSVAAVIINQQFADPRAPQHVILALFKNGEIVYIDPQIGAIVELNLESGMALDVRYQR